jgi:hypothetical protein
MKWLLHIASAIRLARGNAGLWLGQIQEDGTVVGERVALEDGHRTHFSLGMYSEKRWRYREDSTALFWWGLSDVTEKDKRAVEHWLRARGLRVRHHLGNSQRVKVGGQEMWGFEYSHGNGRPSRWWRRVVGLAASSPLPTPLPKSVANSRNQSCIVAEK